MGFFTKYKYPKDLSGLGDGALDVPTIWDLDFKVDKNPVIAKAASIKEPDSAVPFSIETNILRAWVKGLPEYKQYEKVRKSNNSADWDIKSWDARTAIEEALPTGCTVDSQEFIDMWNYFPLSNNCQINYWWKRCWEENGFTVRDVQERKEPWKYDLTIADILKNGLPDEEKNKKDRTDTYGYWLFVYSKCILQDDNIERWDVSDGLMGEMHGVYDKTTNEAIIFTEEKDGMKVWLWDRNKGAIPDTRIMADIHREYNFFAFYKDKLMSASYIAQTTGMSKPVSVDNVFEPWFINEGKNEERFVIYDGLKNVRDTIKSDSIRKIANEATRIQEYVMRDLDYLETKAKLESSVSHRALDCKKILGYPFVGAADIPYSGAVTDMNKSEEALVSERQKFLKEYDAYRDEIVKRLNHHTKCCESTYDPSKKIPQMTIDDAIAKAKAHNKEIKWLRENEELVKKELELAVMLMQGKEDEAIAKGLVKEAPGTGQANENPKPEGVPDWFHELYGKK